MTTTNNSVTRPFSGIGIRMFTGAAIALLIIVTFLLQVNEPDPAWPKYWMVRPLIITPLAGATGGAIYYFINNKLAMGGWKKILVRLFSILVFIFILWVGIVLGLDGTLWD